MSSLPLSRNPEANGIELAAQARKVDAIGARFCAYERVAPTEMGKQFDSDEFTKLAAQTISIGDCVSVLRHDQPDSSRRLCRAGEPDIKVGGLHSFPRSGDELDVRFLR